MKNKKSVFNFALEPCENTLKQFDECTNEPFVISAALMPDAHSGYVAPIGSVIVTKDYIVPSWVGYDIGCGMIAGKITGDENIIKKVQENTQKLFEKVQEYVPMGMGKVNHIQNVTKETKNQFKELLETFKYGKYDKEIFKYIKNKALSHLGSLGDGNHFIELLQESSIRHTNQNQNLWLVVHSGSRGIGHKVAAHYMKEAAHKDKKFEITAPLKADSQKGKEYLNILDFGLNFALLNRLEMAKKVELALQEVLGNNDLKFELWTNKNHNHAIKENDFFIHRKGATPAKLGERGIIPANMKDGCYLVEGLGNKDFLESSSHGAGRRLSRTQTKKSITLAEFKHSMEGICGTVKQGTLDEAPQAYKNISKVMELQKDSVKIIKHLTPIINWKGER